MPKSFWAEAVLCAVYLLNRYPTKSLDTKTPQEAWSSHKPSVSHLRVFGSIAYIKVPEARRTKLEDKGEKCILVGYGDRTMGYRLYNPITKKVIFSRDVIFEENESWNWDQTKASRSAELISEEETREVATEPQIPRDQQTPQRGSSSPQRYDAPLPIERDFSDMMPRGTRSLEDMYENTEQVEEDVTLYYSSLYLLNATSFKLKNLTSGVYTTRGTIFMMRIDSDGLFRLYSHSLGNSNRWSVVWNSTGDRCDPKGLCGLNNFCFLNDLVTGCSCLPGFALGNQDNRNSDCERNFTSGSCKSKGKKYTLEELNNTIWEDVSYSVLSNTSKEDCSQACLVDCNCEAALFKDGVCRKQRLPFRYGRRTREKKLIWVIAIVVVVAVLLPASYIVYRWRRRPKEKEEMERSQDMLLFDINMSMKTSTSELSEEERAKGKSKDSCGYMSPEYALQGLFSVKSYVFSFGVLLLETLSSKKNIGFYNTDSLNLLGHVILLKGCGALTLRSTENIRHVGEALALETILLGNDCFLFVNFSSALVLMLPLIAFHKDK
ncbi:hypothetical protein EZV62_008486 [Acer yangbiense]|uniref:Uncharacterized protein n=1 Tax=Acer yangbiense TaxID=1000413 RepID=A0A5C7IDF4_9ROSI|nr:hypothetical protein EZV62_008486 [Acer yangbiense]